jgi:hypothetical protein
MTKNKNKENFINAGGTGNLDDGDNETIMVPWTDSISVPATKYTLEKKRKEKNAKDKNSVNNLR